MILTAPQWQRRKEGDPFFPFLLPREEEGRKTESPNSKYASHLHLGFTTLGGYCTIMKHSLRCTQITSILFTLASVITTLAHAKNQHHVNEYAKRDNQGDVISLSRSNPVQAAKLVQQFPGLAGNVSFRYEFVAVQCVGVICSFITCCPSFPPLLILFFLLSF